MDPKQLKSEFGDKITFWGGGIDTQLVLPEADPEEIAEHVHQRIRILGHSGGFVFAPVHNIQANVPPENIVAAYDAAIKSRDYPIS